MPKGGVMPRRFAGPILTALAVTSCLPALAAEIDHDPGESGDMAVILITGEIQRGDVEKFRDLSVRYPEAIVGLDSGGGALAPALEIGRMIRLRGYITAVLDDAQCTSACALIWLAGNPRMLSRSGSLGFHASYQDVGGKLVETGVGNAMVGHYLSQLSLPEKAVIFATSASPYEIRWLNEANRYSAGIEFTPMEPDRESDDKANAKSNGATSLRPPSPVPPPVTISRSAGEPLAAPSATSLESQLKAVMRKPGFSDQIAAETGLVGNQARIFSAHIENLYANDKFIARLASEMRKAGKAIYGPQAESVGYELGAAVLQNLLFAGLLRLPNTSVVAVRCARGFRLE